MTQDRRYLEYFQITTLKIDPERLLPPGRSATGIYTVCLHTGLARLPHIHLTNVKNSDALMNTNARKVVANDSFSTLANKSQSGNRCYFYLQRRGR